MQLSFQIALRSSSSIIFSISDSFSSSSLSKKLACTLLVEKHKKTSTIIKIIDKFIQGEATGKRTIYLRFSEAIYKAIRDTPEAQVLRTKYQITLKEERKKLKNKRIKKYKIKKDELTDNALIKHRAEFSHIRSFAIFKDIADDIENGLIVNKSTHEIITKEGINDEDELLILCKEKGWKTDWYNKFKCYFELN